MDEYSGNSNLEKREKRLASEHPDKQIEKVVTGEVVTKKKSGLKKILGMLVTDDIGEVKSHILFDVIIPSIGNALCSAIKDSADMIFHGGSRSSKDRDSRGRISYQKYWERDRVQNNGYAWVGREFDLDDIKFRNRGDADIVLDELDAIIQEYGFASISDLYDLVGLSNKPYTAEKYGWTNIRSARPSPIRDGWVLILPKAMPLD